MQRDELQVAVESAVPSHPVGLGPDLVEDVAQRVHVEPRRGRIYARSIYDPRRPVFRQVWVVWPAFAVGLVHPPVVGADELGVREVDQPAPVEVRGIGVLNIRTIFGETAVRPRKTLKLIMHLAKAGGEKLAPMDRLQMQAATQDILGVPIRKLVIPVAAGRNLAVLVEAAVRNYILQLRGIDSTREFIERHQKFMEMGE